MTPPANPSADEQAKILLEQLRPIFVPDAASFWPLAAGWWAAGGLSLVALAALIWWLFHRHARAAYRRQALKMIEPLSTCSPEQLPQLANTLLKRTALSAYSTERTWINAAFGDEWVQWLNARCPHPVFTGATAQDLAEGGYTPTIRADRDALLQAVQLWILKHRPLTKQQRTQVPPATQASFAKGQERHV